jgi:hypothetical protein
MSADEDLSGNGRYKDLADELLEKVVLVGLILQAPDGELIEQKQFYGSIASVDAQNGIRIALEGAMRGQYYSLPPDIRYLNPADPGKYKLRATGEVVIDPDFTCQWVLVRQLDS